MTLLSVKAVVKNEKLPPFCRLRRKTQYFKMANPVEEWPRFETKIISHQSFGTCSNLGQYGGRSASRKSWFTQESGMLIDA